MKRLHIAVHAGTRADSGKLATVDGLNRYPWVVGEVLSPRRPESWSRDPRVLRRVRELSEALRFDRGHTVGQPYLQDEMNLRAYLAYFVPWNLLRLEAMFAVQGGLPDVLRRLLAAPAVSAPPGGAAASADDGAGTTTLIDLGSGPLVMALYLAMAAPQLMQRRIVFHAVDPVPAALEVGRAILDRLAPGHRWVIRPLEADFDRVFSEPELLPWASAALVTETFSLNEWARSRYRREKLLQMVATLAAMPSPGTELLCIEPGNREAGRLLPALRVELLQAKAPITVLGPCTHHRTCPILATRDRSWCHFRKDARAAPDWLVEVGSRAELPKERLFFSYLWWRHGVKPAASHGGDVRARILGEPMRLAKERAGVYACEETGRVVLSWPLGRRPDPPSLEVGAVYARDRRLHGRFDPPSGATDFAIEPRGGAAGGRPGERDAPRGQQRRGPPERQSQPRAQGKPGGSRAAQEGGPREAREQNQTGQHEQEHRGQREQKPGKPRAQKPDKPRAQQKRAPHAQQRGPRQSGEDGASRRAEEPQPPSP